MCQVASPGVKEEDVKVAGGAEERKRKSQRGRGGSCRSFPILAVGVSQSF